MYIIQLIVEKKIFFCAFLLLAQTFLIKAQSKITFKLYAPGSKNKGTNHLYLAGSFNGWKAADAALKLQQVSGDAKSDNMVADMQKMADLVRAKSLSKANTSTVIIKGAAQRETMER